ncbi:MAG: VIT family protein [Candidatus Omnitrophica bacterium]|jgi:VIT1/CCC1 family predicted Fe2+/Mn2+ transporter|nr:VIT family protein [Candidatus Omnitrophota bacterium]
MRRTEFHSADRIGGLRAAVLGANDGIVSISSLVIGVASAGAHRPDIWMAGLAGLIAGAMSMAAGEYVSVSSQSDSEKADRLREMAELKADPKSEREELAAIYVKRGLTPELAGQVSDQLMKHDALGAHLRDELGITETMTARPIQAAIFSAGAFTVGGLLPVLMVLFVPGTILVNSIAVFSLILLGLMGFAAARIGGASVLRSCARIVFWGALAMAITAGAGRLFEAVV